MLFTGLSSELVVRALKKAGFEIVSEGKHIGLSNGERHVTVPRHPKINPYMLKGIIKSAGLTDAEFKELLGYEPEKRKAPVSQGLSGSS